MGEYFLSRQSDGDIPSEDMPVIHDANGIIGSNSVDNGTAEGDTDSFEL